MMASMVASEMRRQLMKQINKGLPVKNAYYVVKVSREIKWEEQQKGASDSSNHQN